METGLSVEAKLLATAKKFLKSEGFYQRSNPDLLSEDFIWEGPVVGPLNKTDFLGTVNGFRVYEAFPDLSVQVSNMTLDTENPRKVWALLRVKGTHTGPLHLGPQVVAATSKEMEVGPQIVSVELCKDLERVVRYTGGYVVDRRLGKTGLFGAFYAIAVSIGVPVPRPGGTVSDSQVGKALSRRTIQRAARTNST